MEKMLSDVLLEKLENVRGIAGTLVWRIDEIDDLVQDLAERVWRNDAPASNYERPLAYFSKIMRNLQFDHRKKEYRAGVKIIPTETFEAYAAVEDVESTAEYNRTKRIIREEFALLSPEMQEAFMMVYYDGFALEDVAKQMGIPSNTLSKRFSRFRQQLKKRLHAETIAISMILMAILNPR